MIEKKVFIYGLCNVYYDSFYIQGLREVFQNIEFNITKFPNFKYGTFAIIIIDGKRENKIVIDSRDSTQIDLEELNWCDKYGKVNYNEKTIFSFENRNKIIAIGPSFGIKIWNFFNTLSFGFSNYFKFKSKILNKREFIANYWRQYGRLSIENYNSSKSMDNEVFFISTIWKNESLTNNFRASFILACRGNNNLKFLGGFAPRNDGNNLGFDSLVYPKKIALPSYISKIKKSSFVYNTPAVLSCHGWKLAEFLALGKAILSTSHKNSMPEILKDNIHIAYVESQEDMEIMINKMITDIDFKKELEVNSRDYFERNLAPKVIINKLLGKNL